MNRIGVVLLTIFVLAMLLGTSGCVLGQTLAMNPNNSGLAATDLIVDEFFIGVLEDFQSFVPENPDETIMDVSVRQFSEGLHNKPSVSNIYTAKTGPTSYMVVFDYADLNRFMLDMNNNEQQSLLKVSKSGTRTTFSIHLDLKTYPQLTKLIPFLNDPNFETFGPLYNEGMSEADYLDMISYILGEDGPPSIEASTISLLLTVPKPLISVKCGTMLGDKTARLEIPLIDFLLLAKPITFSATW